MHLFKVLWSPAKRPVCLITTTATTTIPISCFFPFCPSSCLRSAARCRLNEISFCSCPSVIVTLSILLSSLRFPPFPHTICTAGSSNISPLPPPRRKQVCDEFRIRRRKSRERVKMNVLKGSINIATLFRRVYVPLLGLSFFVRCVWFWLLNTHPFILSLLI